MSATKDHRKSVAFSEGATLVSSEGEVTQVNGTANKASAESHTASICISFSRATRACSHFIDNQDAPPSDPAVDEVSELFKGLGKKKKSSKKPKEESAEVAEEVTPAADGEFDPTALKKKKKKPKAKGTDSTDFEAKLAEAGVNGEGETNEDANAKAEEGGGVEGDMDIGTGIWGHDETRPIRYDKLLERFFAHLHSAHPDLMAGGSKSYVIPPPQCLREGNKKTIFANIPDICKRMKRSDEHVMQFIFAELGTSGSVDGSRRLVIKGRFQQKQIEGVLRRYIGTLPSIRLLQTPLTFYQSSMSLAKHVEVQTQNSARGRTVFHSSPAILAEVGGASQPSRQVIQHKSVKERGNRCKWRGHCRSLWKRLREPRIIPDIMHHDGFLRHECRIKQLQ